MWLMKEAKNMRLEILTYSYIIFSSTVKEGYVRERIGETREGDTDEGVSSRN
jgi:hypothetical protein